VSSLNVWTVMSRAASRSVFLYRRGDGTCVEDGVEGYSIKPDSGKFFGLGVVDYTMVDLEAIQYLARFSAPLSSVDDGIGAYGVKLLVYPINTVWDLFDLFGTDPAMGHHP